MLYAADSLSSGHAGYLLGAEGCFLSAFVHTEAARPLEWFVVFVARPGTVCWGSAPSELSDVLSTLLPQASGFQTQPFLNLDVGMTDLRGSPRFVDFIQSWELALR